MPLDHRRLVDGLSAAAAAIDDDEAGLAAIDPLVNCLREATGAIGATYIEFGEGGGRVMIAAGELAWSLGQPIGLELGDPERLARVFAGPVEGLPRAIADPLLVRGVLAIVGCPVKRDGRTVGGVHVYFPDVDPKRWAEAEPALRAVAGIIAGIYRASRATATGGDDDDRTLFLAVAGHELRTPVTVVKGYARMLADRWEGLDESHRREGVRVLAQRADELARLVDRMLGASVGDSAAGWLVRTVPFDPVEAILRATRDLPADLRAAIHLELPNSLPPALGDPSILNSIMAELVTNAVRYGLTGAVTHEPESVDIQAGADAHTVFFRVADRGVGVDPAHVERAFERFWRARRDGDTRSGVGLGLYLVRRLVERQNGWVSLRARDGGGTVAEVRLPRADGSLHRPGRGEA